MSIPGPQVVAPRCPFPGGKPGVPEKRLHPGLGQETYKLSLDHRATWESRSGVKAPGATSQGLGVS